MLFRLIMMVVMSCSVACYGITDQVSAEQEKKVLQEVIVALEQEQASKAQRHTHRTALIATAVSLGVITVACVVYLLKKHQSRLVGEQPARPISNQSASATVSSNVPGIVSYPDTPPPSYVEPSEPVFRPLGAFLDD